MVYTQKNEVLSSLKKEGSLATCHNMMDLEDIILSDMGYGGLGRENREMLVKGYEVLVMQDKSVLGIYYIA